MTCSAESFMPWARITRIAYRVCAHKLMASQNIKTQIDCSSWYFVSHSEGYRYEETMTTERADQAQCIMHHGRTRRSLRTQNHNCWPLTMTLTSVDWTLFIPCIIRYAWTTARTPPHWRYDISVLVGARQGRRAGPFLPWVRCGLNLERYKRGGTSRGQTADHRCPWRTVWNNAIEKA